MCMERKCVRRKDHGTHVFSWKRWNRRMRTFVLTNSPNFLFLVLWTTQCDTIHLLCYGWYISFFFLSDNLLFSKYVKEQYFQTFAGCGLLLINLVSPLWLPLTLGSLVLYTVASYFYDFHYVPLRILWGIPDYH